MKGTCNLHHRGAHSGSLTTLCSRVLTDLPDAPKSESAVSNEWSTAKVPLTTGRLKLSLALTGSATAKSTPPGIGIGSEWEVSNQTLLAIAGVTEKYEI